MQDHAAYKGPVRGTSEVYQLQGKIDGRLRLLRQLPLHIHQLVVVGVVVGHSAQQAYAHLVVRSVVPHTAHRRIHSWVLGGRRRSIPDADHNTGRD